jgi:hypothetical protein
VITGYSLGLHYGANGVAIGFSAAMTLWLLPHIAWGVHGTPISFGDVMKVMTGPLVSGAVAAALALGVQFLCSHWLPFFRLCLGVTVLLGAYSGMLLYGIGQKTFYMDLLRGLLKRPPIEEEQPVLTQEV